MENCNISKSVLIVTGIFNEDTGKYLFFGQVIYEAFNNIFPDAIEYINGGNIDILSKVVYRKEHAKIIVWMPQIDNSVDKYLSKIKTEHPTALLIRLKRNDFHEYTIFQIVEEMFQTHSNLCLEIDFSKDDTLYYRVLDPLGNLWYSGESITEASRTMVLFAKLLISLTRMRSYNDLTCSCYLYDSSFLEAVRVYGWRFSALINTAVPMLRSSYPCPLVVVLERFLGNASIRCMPDWCMSDSSVKQKNIIFVSRRNIDKKDIEEMDFVPVALTEHVISYQGSYKPSIDTPVQVMLYEYYPEIRYIIHGHVYVTGAPFTDKYIPCGYIEEFYEITNKFRDHLSHNFSINLIGHGCLMLAKDLSYLAGIGMEARPFPEILNLSHMKRSSKNAT